MKREYLSRFSAIVLAIATLTAVVLAVVNFKSELSHDVPSDGVWWVEHEAWLRAEQVQGGGAGERAGIRAGDELAALNGNTINSVA
jgi:membrane-associated protease RseP (regulator of RpoE activity)